MMNHPTAYFGDHKYIKFKNDYLKELYEDDDYVPMLAQWVGGELGFGREYSAKVKECTLAVIYDLLSEDFMSIYYFSDDTEESAENLARYPKGTSTEALLKRTEIWNQLHGDILFPKVTPEEAVKKIDELWDKIYGEKMPGLPVALAWFRITEKGEKYLRDNKIN